MKPILSIDPGSSGGFAWLEDGQVKTLPMLTTDGDILCHLRHVRALGIEDCHIEHVCGFVASAGAGQMFSFGEGFGFIKGCLMSLGFRIHLHRPQKWQKAMSLGSKKDHGKAWKKHLKQRAQELFPNADVTLKTADALLIFEYGQKL